jgi:hypothetical protein
MNHKLKYFIEEHKNVSIDNILIYGKTRQKYCILFIKELK